MRFDRIMSGNALRKPRLSLAFLHSQGHGLPCRWHAGYGRSAFNSRRPPLAAGPQLPDQPERWPARKERALSCHRNRFMHSSRRRVPLPRSLAISVTHS